MAAPWEKYAKSESAAPWEKYKKEEAQVGGLEHALERYDAYGGAPMRSALSAAQHGENPISAYKGQLGAPAETAPSGKEIAEYAGVPKTAASDVAPGLYSDTGNEWLKLKKGGLLDPSASGVAGAAIDVVTDPGTYAPIGKGLKVAGEAIHAIPGVKPALAMAGHGLTKLASATSGIAEDLIANYAKHTDQIEKLIKQYGPDIATASDDVRQKFMAVISTTRKGLSGAISKTLETVDPARKISVTPIIESLTAARNKINANLRPEDVAVIDEMIARVTKDAPGGITSPQGLYDLSTFLNDHAKGAFAKDGTIFNKGSAPAKIARDATAQSRNLIKQELPEIAEANGKLHKLHIIEENLNKNLISPGKPEGALITAGSGANRGRKSLQLLERMTGEKFVQPATDLATQKAFAHAGILPNGAHTGYAVGRMGVGGLIGYEAGGNLQSMIEGAALSSPAAIKGLIKSGRLTGKIASKIGVKKGLLTAAEVERQKHAK